jgi:predicted RND superfamily exporter protein
LGRWVRYRCSRSDFDLFTPLPRVTVPVGYSVLFAFGRSVAFYLRLLLSGFGVVAPFTLLNVVTLPISLLVIVVVVPVIVVVLYYYI